MAAALPPDVLHHLLGRGLRWRFFRGGLGLHLRSFVTTTKPQPSLNHNLRSVPLVLTGNNREIYHSLSCCHCENRTIEGQESGRKSSGDLNLNLRCCVIGFLLQSKPYHQQRQSHFKSLRRTALVSQHGDESAMVPISHVNIGTKRRRTKEGPDLVRW